MLPFLHYFPVLRQYFYHLLNFYIMYDHMYIYNTIDYILVRTFWSFMEKADKELEDKDFITHNRPLYSLVSQVCSEFSPFFHDPWLHPFPVFCFVLFSIQSLRESRSWYDFFLGLKPLEFSAMGSKKVTPFLQTFFLFIGKINELYINIPYVYNKQVY